MHRQIAGKLTGRVTKWIVLVAWVIIFVVCGGFSAKLTDVQNNEASSWLPESAESTKVLEELSTTVDPNDIPTLVVYHRESGLTDEDFAAMDEQAAEIAEIDGVTDAGVLSPNVAEEQGAPVQLVSDDGQVGLPLPHLQLRRERLERHPGRRRRGPRDRPDRRRHRPPRRLRRPGGRLCRGLRGHRHQPASWSPCVVVIVILLLTYRSPVLWILPILGAVFAYVTSAGVVYLLAKYADLTVNGQSQAILGILVIGAGTDYALLLVARYREELRRHEDRHEAMAFALHRAAPAILASAATVVRRHAVPDVRRAQLHRRPGPRHRHRHRRSRSW